MTIGAEEVKTTRRRVRRRSPDETPACTDRGGCSGAERFAALIGLLPVHAAAMLHAHGFACIASGQSLEQPV